MSNVIEGKPVTTSVAEALVKGLNPEQIEALVERQRLKQITWKIVTVALKEVKSERQCSNLSFMLDEQSAQAFWNNFHDGDGQWLTAIQTHDGSMFAVERALVGCILVETASPAQAAVAMGDIIEDVNPAQGHVLTPPQQA